MIDLPAMITRTEMYDSRGEALITYVNRMEEAGWAVRQITSVTGPSAGYLYLVVYERERTP